MKEMKEPNRFDLVGIMLFVAAIATFYLFRGDGVIPAGLLLSISIGIAIFG